MAVYGGFDPGSFNAWTLNLFADVFVLPGVARGMQVTAPGGMQVQLTLDGTANDGVVYLPNGAFIRIDTVQTFPVPNNSSGGTRTDAVVAFVDPTGIASPSFSLTYVTNWASTFSPGNNNQQVIALVSVPNGAVSIATGNITNNPNPAKLTGTAGSNSMVAADGVGLTVQDNTGSATLSVVLTGLTTTVGRSIVIQTTDISAIGHQSTFDQKGNLVLSGSLTTYGRNIFNGLNPTVPSAYDNVVLTPWSTPYSVNIGAADGSFGGGIGLYAWDNFNSAFIFKAGTANGITFNGSVTALHQVIAHASNNTNLDDSLYQYDHTGALGMSSGWNPNNGWFIYDQINNGFIVSAGTKNGITFGGNVTVPNTLAWNGGIGGYISQVIGGHYTEYKSSASGVASGHLWSTWDGANVKIPFSVGGQFAGAFSWIDNAGTINATNYFGPAGVSLPTTRNGGALSVPIFTGTSNPTSPPTGSIWVKA